MIALLFLLQNFKNTSPDCGLAFAAFKVDEDMLL